MCGVRACNAKQAQRQGQWLTFDSAHHLFVQSTYTSLFAFKLLCPPDSADYCTNMKLAASLFPFKPSGREPVRLTLEGRPEDLEAIAVSLSPIAPPGWLSPGHGDKARRLKCEI